MKKLIHFLMIAFLTFININHVWAQKTENPATVIEPVQAPKTTAYPNGIYKIEPAAFGVTKSVKDLPVSVENAKEKSEAYLTKQKLEAIRKQQLRDKGVPEEEITNDEINRANAKVIKKVLPNAGAGQAPFTDPLVNLGVLNRNLQGNLMSSPILTFDGATQLDNAAQGIGAVLPPDVNGDVGLNHYVSSVNLVYKIFNKNGTVAAGPFRTNALFSGLPASDPCRVNNSGDPIVVYDPLADRWHISQFAITGTTNCQCVAVSKTGDPTGDYFVWRYDYPNQLFNDYPKVGVWSDAYHMTFNQFNNAGTAFLGMGILSQDRPKALAGDPAASVVYTNIATIDPNAGGGLPADIDGFVAPPAGMAEVIAEYRADEFGDPLDAIRYYKWVPDFVNPANSTITVLPDVALAPFDARQPGGRGDIEQNGGASLDALSDRLMHRFAYRNLGTQAAPINSFVGSFAVNVSGVNPTSATNYQTGIRWFEMRRNADAFSIFDQGTHNLTPGNGASGLNNWMGSIAQDNNGNIALGFSQSGTGQRADIKIAGRTNNVMNSGVLNEGETLFYAATGSQTSSSSRWGDYSAMNVDPVDDCTFWYTQEYYGATSSAGWSTRIGKFVMPTCTPAPRATIQGTITLCVNGLPVEGASVDATGGFNRVTSAAGTYSMTVAPGTYTFFSSKGAGLISTTTTITVVDGQTYTVDLCLAGVPILSAGSVMLVSESCIPANGVIDPGETVTVEFAVQNIGGANTVNDMGTLQASGWVTNPGAPVSYGVISAGGPAISRQFTFTADELLQCGANITANITHNDGASNFGNLIYIIPSGVSGVVPNTFSYTGPSVAIPDNNPAGVNITLPVSGLTGAISDVDFRLDALAGCDAAIGNTNASVTHTFLADLTFKLTSPSGTTIILISGRGGGGNNFCTVLLDDDGGFPATSTMPTSGAVGGNFAPENPLSAFDGQDPNGNWILNVSDNAGVDVGSLNRFSLIFTNKTCCETSTTPIITAVPVTGSIAACAGTASVSPDIQQFTVSGSLLTTDITVTAPANFEVSTNAGSGYGASVTLTESGGNVPVTDIYVRSAATAAAGPIAGNVSLVSGTTTVDVAVSGTVNALPVPVVTAIYNNGYYLGDVTICSGSTVQLSTQELLSPDLHITNPINAYFHTGFANFGPSVLTTPINGDMVYLPDGSASYLGCDPYTAGALAGKIALIDRGTCTFVQKVLNAQDVGAIGVIIVNNVSGVVNMGGSNPAITIPTVSISQDDGNTIKNLLTGGSVSGNTITGYSTYAWSTGATSPTISVSPTSIATYSVTVTDASGCAGTSNTFTINVNPTPDAIATPATQTVCSGAAINSIALTGNVAGTIFNWTRDNAIDVTGIAASGAGDITGTLINTTNAPITVTFTITPTANDCTGTAVTATVLVNPTPDAIATPATQTVCSGEALNSIALTGNVSGTTFNWVRDNPGVTGIAASGSGDITGTLINTSNAPITVTFTITPTANGCAGTAITATVLVNPTPNAIATPASQSICSGSAMTTIALTGSVSGTTYSWTRDNELEVSGIAASGTGDISGTLTSNSFSTVTVTFTITPINGTCIGAHITATVIVNQITLPLIHTSGPTTFCEGGSVTLSAISQNGYKLNLSSPHTNSFDIGVALFGAPLTTTPLNGDFVYIPDASASYLGCSPYTAGSLAGKVALIDRGTCNFTLKALNAQNAGATGVVIVNNSPGLVNMAGVDPSIIIPTISISQSDGSILKNLILLGTVGGSTILQHTYSYLWSTGETSASISVNQSDYYTVQVTDENNCTPSTAGGPVTVNPTPNAVATPDLQRKCSGNPITTIVLSGNVSGAVYNWTRDNTATVTGIAASGSGNISGTLTNTTNAPVTVTFTITPTANDCSGIPVTATVVVNPTPNTVATPASQTVCSGTAITTIVLSGSVSGTVYNWTRNNTGITGINASGAGDISGTLTNNGTTAVTVTFTITPTANDCSGTPITATVTVNPLTYTTNPSSQTIFALNNTSFSVTATGTAPVSYQWQESTNGGTSYNNLSDGGVYSNTTTSTLNLTTVPGSMNGNKYRCVVTGGCSVATSLPATLTVQKRPTTITYTGDNNEQYSDQQTLKAILKDQATNALLVGKTVKFTIGVQSVSDGPGAPGNGTDINGEAYALLKLYQNIGSYNVVAIFEGDDNYDVSMDTKAFTITKENAVVDYTGPEFISTPCATCATTTILLTASVKDTTSAYPLNDIYPGDIRKARAKFINLNTNTDISGWLTPGLVNPADTTDGIVSYSWTVPLPNTGYDVYSIGVVVDCTPSPVVGNYIGSTETVLSISRSTLTEFITGGGNIIPTSSNGQYASDPNRKVNFGFNVKYNKSFKNIQGNMNVIFRRAGRIYQIKATSLTSLSINSTNPCSRKANFTSKANLTDITVPGAPISIYGGITLQVTMTDNGNPGNTDRIGITLLNGNSLVYSSNWVSTQTTELVLNGGNLVVHNGVVCPGTMVRDITSNVPREVPVTNDDESFSVNVFPNPSSNEFKLQVISKRDAPFRIRILDENGIVKERKFVVSKANTVSVGANLPSGTYFAEVIMGDVKRMIKIIKIK